MRNYDPSCEFDAKELKRLNPEPWQVKMLELNPSYVCWGPGEDYMPSAEKGGGRGLLRPHLDRRLVVASLLIASRQAGGTS
jgi:hypothetical protein